MKHIEKTHRHIQIEKNIFIAENEKKLDEMEKMNVREMSELRGRALLKIDID